MILIVAVALVGMGINEVWQERKAALDAAKIPPPEVPREALSEGGTTPGVSTRTIIARNLFDPDRGAKAIEPPAPDTSPKEPEQSIDGLLLLGTVIAGSERYAIMKVPPDLGSVPSSRRGRPTRQVKNVQGGAGVRRIRVGDSLRGYRVENIEEQKVVLMKGTAKTEVTIDYTREAVAPPKPTAKAKKSRRTSGSRTKRTRRTRDRGAR